MTVNRKTEVYKIQFGFLNSMANEVAFFYGFGIMNAWQRFGNWRQVTLAPGFLEKQYTNS